MRTDIVDLQFDLQFMIVCECIAFYFFDGHIFLHLNFFFSVLSDMTNVSFQSFVTLLAHDTTFLYDLRPLMPLMPLILLGGCILYALLQLA